MVLVLIAPTLRKSRHLPRTEVVPILFFHPTLERKIETFPCDLTFLPNETNWIFNCLFDYGFVFQPLCPPGNEHKFMGMFDAL
jgi:hypothetical protein